MTAVGLDPAIYEHWLGAATDLMLDQAGVGPGSRVLDVAAGAGGQTLAAAARSGPEGLVLATDISNELVASLRANALAAGATHVYAVPADAERFDGEPGAFDAAICRLGLTFLSDVRKALRGIRAALRPGGRLSAIVFAEPEHDARFEVIQGPFSLSRPGTLEAALADAGFVDIEVEPVDAPLRFPTDGFNVPCRLLVGGGRRS
jgi:ubiquinone/menaquinone biosynthesis C-methylase UbiE